MLIHTFHYFWVWKAAILDLGKPCFGRTETVRNQASKNWAWNQHPKATLFYKDEKYDFSYGT